MLRFWPGAAGVSTAGQRLSVGRGATWRRRDAPCPTETRGVEFISGALPSPCRSEDTRAQQQASTLLDDGGNRHSSMLLPSPSRSSGYVRIKPEKKRQKKSMEAGWRARLKGADQKENSSPRGRAQTTGLAVAGREGTTRERADEPGPRGEENEKRKGDRHPEKSSHHGASRARSPAPGALSPRCPGWHGRSPAWTTRPWEACSPGGGRGTGHRAPDHPRDLPELVHHFAGRRTAQSQGGKEQKGGPWKENVFRSLGALCCTLRSLRRPWKRGDPAGGTWKIWDRLGRENGSKMDGNWGGRGGLRGPGGGIARRG